MGELVKTRAYSILNIKSVDDSQRVFRGMATTPSTDRDGDVIDPLGCEFRNPSALLWMHDHTLPVGSVKFGRPTKEGVPFEATIPQIDNPAGLKARVDEAWSSVVSGLISAVSIGFRALEWSVNEQTGGLNFLKTELVELSLVSVPSNRDATITGIKSFDAEVRKAALGKKTGQAKKLKPSGVSGKTVKLTPREGKNPMKIAEQIKNFQNERAAKAAKMEEIMEKSAETGETLDDAQAETFDTLKNEIESIDKHLGRLESAQKAQISSAKPVTEKAGQSESGASEARGYAQVRAAKPSEPGIQMARVVRCLGLAKGNRMEAAEIAKAMYSNDDAIVETFTKTAVAAATTTGTTNAAPLVPQYNSVIADFVEFLRPQTIVGKFGLNGVPALRNIPFYTRIVDQTSGGSAGWVGEGKAKPVTAFDFSGTILTPLKVAAISVATEELLNNSSPSADVLIRDGLVAAARERLDIDFVDPTKTASAGVSPASITNGITPIVSAGATAEDIRSDIKALWATFLTNNVNATSAVYILSAQTALALSLMRNALGQREFPDITMMGGMLDGVPAIVSEYVSRFSTVDGGYVVLANASDIYLGDEGGFRVDFSREATIQMDTAPTQSSSPSVALSTGVSMFQTNSVAFRAERTINWQKRRASAVAVLSEVNWGAAA